jgi:putative ABC transport system permease protein
VKSGSAVKEFRIAGFSEEVLGGTAYIALADAQQMAGLGDAFNAIWLKVDPAMTQAIRQKLYQLSMIESVQLKDEIVDDWNEMLSLFYRIMLVSLIFAAVMAFAVVFNTITVNAAEREREIATMRTIGESRGNITKMVTLENTITRLMGVIPGLVLGAAVAYYIIQSYSSELWQMAFHIYPSTYLWATLGIIAVAFASQIIPIRRLNRLNLAKATKVLD